VYTWTCSLPLSAVECFRPFRVQCRRHPGSNALMQTMHLDITRRYVFNICIILHCGLPSRLWTTTRHTIILLYYSPLVHTSQTHTIVDNSLDLYNINIIYPLHIKNKLSRKLILYNNHTVLDVRSVVGWTWPFF